jgi:hypothetical protein
MTKAASRSADRPPDQSGPGFSPARRAWLPDAAAIFIIVIGWQLWLYPDVTRYHPVAFDTYRDTATVENILAGRWFRDACISGQTYWYAPLGPIIFAGLSALTGQSPVAIYSSSILWLNVLLPIGWYLLARLCWDRRAAFAAVPLILLGSRWWATHLAMPITSVQGVILLSSVLIAWLVSLRCRRWSAALVGLLLAFCFWYHILSGIAAAATIGLHSLLCWRSGKPLGDGRQTATRHDQMLRLSIVAGITAILVAPLAWHMLRLPRLNVWPVEYIASELAWPRFALQADTPLIIPLALVGLVCACRRLRRPAGLIVVYAAVAFVGMALGYVRMWTSLKLPVLIPHEFQWHFQIAIGLFAAAGTAAIAAWVSARMVGRAIMAWAGSVLVTIALVAWTVGGQLPAANAARREHWKSFPTPESQAITEAVQWIKANTSIDDVFLGSEPNDFFIVAGLTGRKLASPPIGHTCIAEDAVTRSADRTRMLETNSPEEFRRLLARYSVRYILVTPNLLESAQRWRSWKMVERVCGPSSEFTTVCGSPSWSITILRVRE